MYMYMYMYSIHVHYHLYTCIWYMYNSPVQMYILYMYTLYFDIVACLVQYDLQWYCDGTLPSLPGGPKFPCPEAMLKCHALLDRLHLLQKMSHSSKVKLQAARCNVHVYMVYSTLAYEIVRKDIVKEETAIERRERGDI